MPKHKQLKNAPQRLNIRLLAILVLISVALAFAVSAIIVTPKTYIVRVVDNLFLGGVMNLLLNLLMAFRANAEAKAFGHILEARQKNKNLPKEERLKLRQYDVFTMLRKHFGVAAIVLFVLSAIGTIAVML